jgi:hypothetical protein
MGEATDIGFSQVEKKLGYPISGYVPQIRLPQFEYPLLACDTNNIDPGLIGWEDKSHGFDKHNLIYDVQDLVENPQGLFSVIRYRKHIILEYI